MVLQVGKRLGQTPKQWLVDGGFPAHAQLDAVADKTEVYAPVPEPQAKPAKDGKDGKDAKDDDKDEKGEHGEKAGEKK